MRKRGREVVHALIEVGAKREGSKGRREKIHILVEFWR